MKSPLFQKKRLSPSGLQAFRPALRHLSLFLLLIRPIYAAADPAEQVEEVSISQGSQGWTLTGDARFVGTEIELTPDNFRQEGSAELRQQLCSTDWTVEFEANVGDEQGPRGGAGLSLVGVDPHFGPIFGFGLDTYFDAPLDREYEINDNHLQLLSNLATKRSDGVAVQAGSTVFDEIASARAPFRMEGSGWITVELRVRGAQFSVELRAEGTTVTLTGKMNRPAGAPLTLRWNAFTGGAHNRQAIRGVRISAPPRGGC